MKILILLVLFLFVSCDEVFKGVISDESGVDDSFNDPTCTSCGGENNVTSLEDQIVSFWRMEESGATSARSDSRGTSDLIYGGGTLTSVAGQIGSAINCSSMSGSSYFYVSSPSSSYDFGTGTDFSVAFWAKMDGTVGSNQILFEINYPTPFFRVSVNSSSADMVVNADNAMPLTVTSAFPSFGDWFHFTILIDRSAGVSLYRNGVFQGSDPTAVNSNFTTVSDAYVCGGRFSAGPTLQEPFNGDMDSVGVWNRLLNQDEINALYNGNNTLD